MRARLFKTLSRTSDFLESTKGGVTVSAVALTGVAAAYMFSKDKQQADQPKHHYAQTGCLPFVTFHRVPKSGQTSTMKDSEGVKYKM